MKNVGLSIDIVGKIVGEYYLLKLIITNHMNDFVIITDISAADDFLSFFRNKVKELKGILGKHLSLGDGTISYVDKVFNENNFNFFNTNLKDKIRRELVVGAGKTVMAAQLALPMKPLEMNHFNQWLGEFAVQYGRKSTVNLELPSGEVKSANVCVTLTNLEQN